MIWLRMQAEVDYRFLSVLNDFSRFLKYLQYLVTFDLREYGENMGKTGNITYWAIAEGVRRFSIPLNQSIGETCSLLPL
jgi:hypothetical protein